jgi:hypothetical protein
LRHPFHQLAVVLLLAAMAVGIGSAQITPVSPASSTARIRSVKVIPGSEGPAVEIITTRPIAPQIITLQNPSRLVIDLPEAYLPSRKNIDFRSDEIQGIRVNQFQNTPPITRLVVDLVKPIGYSWDAAGNRLMIRLRPLEQKIAPETSVAHNVAPALVPIGPGGSGALVQTTQRTDGGSVLTAGADTAIMHLPRGGEIRVCPGTTVSVNYSQNGRDMLLAMNKGSFEAHYSLETSADSVMTPDFRIAFAGPGEFHYAISADSHGNTCVRSLPGNTASAIVSELMGDGTYQVKQTEQIEFHAGQITTRNASTPPDCGCPITTVPILTTAVTPPSGPNSTGQSNLETAQQLAAAGSATPALPPPDKNQVHVQVDAPFVFRATDPPIPAAPFREVARLSLVYSMRPAPLEVMVLPPPPQEVAVKSRNNGFFGKLKGFFAAIFR